MKNLFFVSLLLLSACGSKITYDNRVQRHRAVASGNAFKITTPKALSQEAFDVEKKCIKTEASDNCPTPD